MENHEQNPTQQAFAVLVKAAELYLNGQDDLAKALMAPQIKMAVEHLAAELNRPQIVPAEKAEAAE